MADQKFTIDYCDVYTPERMSNDSLVLVLVDVDAGQRRCFELSWELAEQMRDSLTKGLDKMGNEADAELFPEPTDEQPEEVETLSHD